MKNYLNAAEKDQLLLLIWAAEALKEFAKDWIGRGNLTEAEHELAEESSGKIMDLVKSICSRMDAKTALLRSLLNKASGYTGQLVPIQTEAAFIRSAKEELGEDAAMLSRDALDKLLEYAMAGTCTPCVWCGDGECPTRELFEYLDVPYYDSEPGPGECPYHIRGGALPKYPRLTYRKTARVGRGSPYSSKATVSQLAAALGPLEDLMETGRLYVLPDRRAE